MTRINIVTAIVVVLALVTIGWGIISVSDAHAFAVWRGHECAGMFSLLSSNPHCLYSGWAEVLLGIGVIGYVVLRAVRAPPQAK